MWNNSPIFRPAIATIIGMVGMNFCLQYFHFSILYTWGCLMLILLLLLTIYLYKSSGKHVKLFTVVALSAFSIIGALIMQWNYLMVEECAHVGRKIRIGTAITNPLEKEKWWTFKLKERDGGIDMIYLAKDTEKHPDNIQIGDSIYIISYFNYPTSLYQRKIEQSLIDDRNIKKEISKKKTKNRVYNNSKISINHHGDKNSVVDTLKNHGFNLLDKEFEGFKRYLFYQGVSSVAFSSPYAWGFYYADSNAINVHRNNMPFYHDIASKMKNKYKMAGFSRNSEAIIEAMTTGNKSEIPTEIKTQFSKAGISHVLALSGFHLTVIITFFDVLLMRGLFKRRWKKITALMIIPVIWTFAFIAGMPPSLVRATAMCSVIQLALVIGNMQQLKNACGIALFAMILFNPLHIMDVGFQLSFLSVSGIASVGLPLCSWFRQKVGKWAFITDIISISLVCTLFTFPLVAYHFGQIPIYSIISNLILSLIATVFMWTAVMWWIFVWWSGANSVFTWVLDTLASFMVKTSELIANFPFATIQFKPNFLQVVFIYITGALVYFFFRNRKKQYYVAISISLLAAIGLHFI